jgi:hypothetical protein
MDIAPELTFRSTCAGIQGCSAIWLRLVLCSNTVPWDAERFGVNLRVVFGMGAVDAARHCKASVRAAEALPQLLGIKLMVYNVAPA